jgi:hypothetical protein
VTGRERASAGLQRLSSLQGSVVIRSSRWIAAPFCYAYCPAFQFISSIGVSHWRLFAGEIVHRDGIFEKRIIARDDSDAAIGHEVAGAVGFGVVADRRTFG